jgi:hypothetical protein
MPNHGHGMELEKRVDRQLIRTFHSLLCRSICLELVITKRKGRLARCGEILFVFLKFLHSSERHVPRLYWRSFRLLYLDTNHSMSRISKEVIVIVLYALCCALGFLGVLLVRCYYSSSSLDLFIYHAICGKIGSSKTTVLC